MGSLHLIIDIWTSKQKTSVMGIKAQFIADWKLQQAVLGFQLFEESHTGENIKNLLKELLQNAYGIGLAEVRLCSDN
jgi:hypothetical protein